MKALVVGGGVAGLATAIALRRVGIDVDVFERAPEIRDVGAGKTLWHNGVQALRWLGVADELRAAGSPVDELRVLSWKGRTLFRMPVGKFGTSLAIQRQDVLDSLAKVIAPRAIRTDARCVGFEQGESHVTAHFEDGSTARGDFLVGADGIFSTVRKGLFPDWEPRYAGHVAWRGIAGVGERGWKAGVSYNWYGRAKHFALIPLRDSRIFWYGTKNLPPDAHDGGKDDVVETFRDLGKTSPA